MPGILVYSEKHDVAAELLTVGRDLGLPLWAASLGPKASAAASQLIEYGAVRVYSSEADDRCAAQPDACAVALATIADVSGASVVLLGSTRRGKELAGRLAQRLGCGAITDATGISVIDGRLLVRRYALGGNTVATDRIETDRQVIAVLPHSVEAVPAAVSGEVVPVAVDLPVPRVKVIARGRKAAATADVESAERLVAVGKGLAKHADMALIEALAAAIGGEIGCTRALAADYGWLGEERIIGISGKITRPRLLISVGISGQIQHTVGILGSKVIVAINKDKGAPIFRVADYGIVGDLYEVVPRLTARLEQRRPGG